MCLCETGNECDIRKTHKRAVKAPPLPARRSDGGGQCEAGATGHPLRGHSHVTSSVLLSSAPAARPLLSLSAG